MARDVFLTNEAALEYLQMCRLSLWMGLIGPHEYLGRLMSLKALCKRDSPMWRYCTRLLSIEECDEADDWPDRPNHNEEMPDDRSTQVGSSRTETNTDDDEEDSDPLILQFIPSISSGLNTWEFHKGDADPIPSVPHGHEIRNDKKKLDPYRGFIYSFGRQIDRAKRDSTVALWNDDLFRQFAREAIEHFIGTNPAWNWRISDPRRLPRKRR